MTLRSRKQEVDQDGRTIASKRQDVELDFKERADAPLLRLQTQQIQFNSLWKDFMFKLSMVSILYSFVHIYYHGNEAMEIVIFHFMSGLFFAVCALWLKETDENGFEAMVFLASFKFRVMMAIMLSQIGIWSHLYFYEKNHDVAFRCVPFSLLYIVLVLVPLRFMRSTTQSLQQSRENLFKSE